MTLQYIKDQKGKDQLLYKGYLYKKVRASRNKTFWKCAEYHKYCCKGRAHTSHDQVIKYLPHLHPPTRTLIEPDQVPYGAKEITVGPESIPKATTASCGALPEVGTKKWYTDHPSQTIQRLRACLKATRQPSPDLQASVTVVETTLKEPAASSVLTSPGFPKFTDSTMDRTFMPNLCKKKHALDSASTQADQEAGRQQFRLPTRLPGETLQEILSRLSTAALQWLCPQEHSKDQIVDKVILEQFLSVLPVDLQTRLKAQEPGSSKEALQLATAYHEQEPARPIQDLITFEDVSVRFTEEEWALLGHKEKNLYWNVMHQNYDNVSWLAGDQIKGESQEEDLLQEVFDPAVEWLEKSKETILQCPEQDLKKICPKNQQKGSSEREEMFVHSKKNGRGPGRETIPLGTEVGLQSQCRHIDYEECGASAIPLNGQKNVNEEDLPGSYEIPSKTNPQNLKQNLIREDQNDAERQQPEDEKSTLFRSHWRNPAHHETRTSQDAMRTTIDDTEQAEPLMLDSNLKLSNGGDLKYVDKSLEIVERISQSPDPDLMLICSKTCAAELNGTAGLTSENQNILESCQPNSSENGGGLEKLSSFGSVSQEPETHILHSDVPRGSEAQYRHTNHGNGDTSKISLGNQLITCSKCKHSDPFRPYVCPNPGESISSLSALIKQRRVDRKCFSGRNLNLKSGAHRRSHTRNNLKKSLNRDNWWYCKQNRSWLLESGIGLKQSPKFDPVTLNTQTGEALYLATEIIRRFSAAGFSSSSSPQTEQQERTFSLPFLDRMATEPTLSQLMTMLQQAAANIAEIKAAVSSLRATVNDLQNDLRNFSRCTVEAEGGISDLEAQLVQPRNDVKATEVKQVGGAIQTNVRAGLWSSLKVERGANSPDWSPNS
ncbi:zinc finger protein 583-like [Candoia aspera]|uniref:zinc finger protein 583-like n=1 Tax=Candoia aspera TaxID=51853 RepID=UPI002FD7BF0A